MIKKDIRDILIYLGVSVKRFLVYLLLNLLTFSFVLLFMFGILMASYRWLARPIHMLLFLLAAMLFYCLIRNTLMFKLKWTLVHGFSVYLKNAQHYPFSDVSEESFQSQASSKENRRFLGDAKAELKKAGMRWVSKDIAVALAIGFTGRLNLVLEKFPDLPVKCRQHSIRYVLVKMLVFVLGLIPFALLSFLLTMGTRSGLTVLVYALGILFAYFLFAAVLEPMLSLFVFKRIFEDYSSRGT